MKPEDAWDLVRYMRRMQVMYKSPELAVWLTSKGGVEIVNAQKTVGAPKGSGIEQ